MVADLHASSVGLGALWGVAKWCARLLCLGARHVVYRPCKGRRCVQLCQQCVGESLCCGRIWVSAGAIGSGVCKASLLGKLGMPYTDPAKAEGGCSCADVAAAARVHGCRCCDVHGQLGWVLCGVWQSGVQGFSAWELGMPYTDPVKAEGACSFAGSVLMTCLAA
jgi:hypothetical protein